MDKIRRIPHEGNQPSDAEDGLGLDGTPGDTEGHGRESGEGLIQRGPGTGGDIAPRRPVGGGELIDETDVEGHGGGLSEPFLQRGPGTGGDVAPRRPAGGGELIDETDVEGHR